MNLALRFPSIHGRVWDAVTIGLRGPWVGERSVEAVTHVEFRGLAIHETIGPRLFAAYTITHIASGCAVVRFSDSEKIVEAMHELLSAGDWTLTAAEMQANVPTRNRLYDSTIRAYQLLGVPCESGQSSNISALAQGNP